MRGAAYVLLGGLSLGLLAPLALAGRRALGLTLLALPGWGLSLLVKAAWAGWLWLALLLALQAWLGGFRWWAWLYSGLLVASLFLFWLGGLFLFLSLTPFHDPITPWLGGLLVLLAFGLGIVATRRYRPFLEVALH